MDACNLMVSRGNLFCTFLSLLCGLDGLDPQGEIQKMADPHHCNEDPADESIFHTKKTDRHDSGDHCNDLAFCSCCHGFFLNKAVKMHFVCAFLRNESVVY